MRLHELSFSSAPTIVQFLTKHYQSHYLFERNVERVVEAAAES